MGSLKSKGSWLSGIFGAIAGAAISIAACFGIINAEQKVAMQEAVVVIQDATVYTASVGDEILAELGKIKDELPKEEFEGLQKAIKDKDFATAQNLIGKITTVGAKESVKAAIDAIKLKIGILKDLAGYIADKNFDAAKKLIAPADKK